MELSSRELLGTWLLSSTIKYGRIADGTYDYRLWGVAEYILSIQLEQSYTYTIPSPLWLRLGRLKEYDPDRF
jgi:hypothetical protein